MARALAALITLGCNAAPATLQSHTVRDSNGVRIVEHETFNTPLQGFLISDRPFLELGGLRDSPREEFESRHPYLSAVVLRNGRIVVNDAARLILFTKSGDFLRDAGRRGTGPGEFRQVQEVCWTQGDTLIVRDAMDGRVSVWDGDGNHIQTYGRPGFVPQNGCSTDGNLLVRTEVPIPSANTSSPRLAHYELRRADGTVVADPGLLPESDYFGPVLRESALLPTGSRIVTADGIRPEVRVHDRGGRLLGLVRSRDTLVPLTDDAWRRDVATMVPSNVTGAAKSEMLQRFLALRRPHAYPAFGRVLADRVGRIWIGDYFDSALWTVLDTSFSIVGRLRLPLSAGARRVDLAGVDSGSVTVKWKDATGAWHLDFFRIAQR